MREIDIILRLGKKMNDIKHFKQFLPLDIDIVVEPFAGSFSVSKYYVKNNICINVHINDNDNVLFYIYKNYKNYINMRNFIQDNLATCKPNELKNNILSLPYDKKFLDYYIQNFIIRGNLHKIIKSRIFNQVEIAILEKSIITNDDYLNIFEQYKDNNKAFLFLDPPYIFSDNKAYNLIDDDVTSIMVKIYEYFLICKCKCMLIINDLYILRYIFKNFIKGSYIKIYMIGKKKCRHLIITNY